MLLVDLSRRAQPHELPELMDQPCSYATLRGCLRDIGFVNRITLAYRPTLSWLTKAVALLPRQSLPLRIIDVGCGGGDSLRTIHAWAARRGLRVSLTGIDLNADAIRAAREATPEAIGIHWVHGDAFSYQAAQPDIVLSSLLTHHLEEEHIVRFLQWMEERASLGWFINDLHRMRFPYRAFGWITKFVPLHPFVQHDGPVSIRRGFLLDDWQRLCAAAGLPLGQVSIEEYRPARLCVGRLKKDWLPHTSYGANRSYPEVAPHSTR